MDYALDLKNFHKESRTKYIVPMSIATEDYNKENNIEVFNDKVFNVIHTNKKSIRKEIDNILEKYSDTEIDRENWVNSEYSPTPTIIESARYMYKNHTVKDISRSDAAVENLTKTTETINKIIKICKSNKEKAICFVTGVPGAGKTLAGLNIATQSNFVEKNNAVFLSGNGPLVEVLQEALARDLVNKEQIKKEDAKIQTTTFINNIHKFRDNYINNNNTPFENIVVFDEAQRSWTHDQLSKFMKNKKNIDNINMSEPECLLEIMNRHKEWCVVVCLVGGGQEINTGEAGIQEWIAAVKNKFPKWKLFISNNLDNKEYIKDSELSELIENLDSSFENNLHLNVSLRSFRSEKLSSFIQNILNEDINKARESYKFLNNYPIKITRDLEKAKNWLKMKKRGSERIGIIASSGGLRLRPYGIWVKSKAQVGHWFLSDENHPESSNMLEKICTEFDIQGLEIDYSLVAWDMDFRIENNMWKFYNFRGDRWNTIHKKKDKKYRLNAYRVLLTRARQGMVIFVPEGVDGSIDTTRNKDFYDETYNFLVNCGIEELE